MLEAGSRIDRGARLNLIGLFLLSFAVGAAADTLQADMDAVLKADARNAGVVVHVHRAAADVLVYDLISVAPTNSMADVFRVLLQFAHTEQAREFKTVQLSLRGAPRFLISGSYFRQLGQEFGAQNPVYTIRMFPESLTKMDGSRAYPSWSGGLIGVVGKQMQDANDFQRRWWMNDLFPAGKSAYPENTGVSQASAPLTAQSVAAAPAPAKPTPPSNPVVEVPEAERGRPVEPAAARGPMPIPAWFATFPGARGLEKTTSPGEADISYNAPASPAEVVGFYRERFRSSDVQTEASFNGIGTTVHASTATETCVIRIDEASAGTSVSAKCALTPAGPAVAIVPKPTEIGTESSSGGLQRTDYAPPQPLRPLSPPSPGIHRVEYTITGSAPTASLTYRNASGGTEQNEVSLPATLSFNAVGGSFVYLSAQNRSGQGDVHVAITVDGRHLQEATSSTPHGIATASGSVPR